MTAIEFNNQLISLHNSLKFFANTLTSNAEEADDLIQDTYLKALTNRDKFADNTNLKAWTYTIMKNTFINRPDLIDHIELNDKQHKLLKEIKEELGGK